MGFQGLDEDQLNKFLRKGMNFKVYTKFAYSKKCNGKKVAVVKDGVFCVNTYRGNRYHYKIDDQLKKLVDQHDLTFIPVGYEHLHPVHRYQPAIRNLDAHLGLLAVTKGCIYYLDVKVARIGTFRPEKIHTYKRYKKIKRAIVEPLAKFLKRKYDVHHLRTLIT